MAANNVATNIGFHQRDHDILSLLAIFIRSYRSLTTGLTLIAVLIDNNFHLPPPINQGAYFEVYSIKYTSLIQKRVPDQSNFPGKPLPQIVAVKCPKVTGELRDKRNQKLWSSMAMELQILRHPDIQSHENIVIILGVCWRSVRGQAMPAFVMELAHTNLQAMMESETEMSTRKMFGLAIDICAGVSALHGVGIIHGDIKPANILIFKDQELGLTAKISDFGSSLLKTDIKEPIHLPFSSGIWQAPECKKALNGEQLITADTFSLALLVAQMLSRGGVMKMLGSEDNTETTYQKAASCAYHTLLAVLPVVLQAEENTRYGSADHRASNDISHGQQNGNSTEGVNVDEEHSYIKSVSQIAQVVGKTVSPHLFEPSIRPSSSVLHRDLRICLSWILHRDTLNPLNYSDTSRMEEFFKATEMNSQEREVFQNPALKAPTEEDKVRFWFYERMTEYFDRSAYAISQQETLPEIADVSQNDSARRITKILENWRKSELPKPEDMYAIRDAGAVVEADKSIGTLKMLPKSCLKQIMSEMAAVAHDEREDKLRRAEAAWQFSMLRFRLQKFKKGKGQEVDSILEELLLAARLGHTVAGGVVGWLYSTFDRALPVSTEEENQWLHAAVCMGSSTARRRLSSRDAGNYNRAVFHLRSRYAGIGIAVPQNYYDTDLSDDLHFLMCREDSPNSFGIIFQLAATGGRYDLMRRLIDLRGHELDINELFEANETALLKACRSGHGRIALLLLENGADPTLANDEGATPLHFLSSFEDEEIPEITDALVQAGANLEARSSQGWRYMQCIDSTYGTVEGTPLTWAVAAGNETATQALIDVGADPFDLQGREIQYEDGWSNSVHVFPVWQAAVTCQHKLLAVLLGSSRNCADRLNEVYRKFGSHGLKDHTALLGWVVTDGNSSTFTRILIHGKEYQQAFENTFEILTKHGASPFGINDKDESVIEMAVDHNQPYILDFLLSWKNGRLIPDTRRWLRCICTACMDEEKAAFKLLVKYSQAEKVSTEQWNFLFATTHALPNDTKSLNRLDHYRRSNADFDAHFWDALVAGKYVLAHWIYETGKCDLKRMTDGTTVLGQLIMSSKSYSNYSGHIDAFLDMEIPDEVYYNVLEWKGSKLSALQAAVIMVEYRRDTFRSLSPLQSILKHKYDPEYLNMTISDGAYKGCTAMHIAVKTCNEEAIRYLLDEEGDSLDLATLDHRGNSLIDLASFLLIDQAPQMDVWEVPQEKRKELDGQHFQNSLMILHLLYSTKNNPKRARPRKIMASVTKVDINALCILLYEPEQFKTMKVEPSVFDGLSAEQIIGLGAMYSLQAGWDLTMIWPQIVERGPKLPLNGSLFIFAAEEMSVEEFENAASMGNIIRREQMYGDPNSEQSELLQAMENLLLQHSGRAPH